MCRTLKTIEGALIVRTTFMMVYYFCGSTLFYKQKSPFIDIWYSKESLTKAQDILSPDCRRKKTKHTINTKKI